MDKMTIGRVSILMNTLIQNRSLGLKRLKEKRDTVFENIEESLDELIELIEDKKDLSDIQKILSRSSNKETSIIGGIMSWQLRNLDHSEE